MPDFDYDAYDGEKLTPPPETQPPGYTAPPPASPFEFPQPTVPDLSGGAGYASQNYQGLYDQVANFQSVYNDLIKGYEATHGLNAGARYNKQKQLFEQYQSQFQGLKDALSPYGIEFGWSSDFGDQIWFTLPGAGGGKGILSRDFNEVLNYLGEQVQTSTRTEQRQDYMTNFLAKFSDWASQFKSGQVTVDPFADKNDWEGALKSIFGDFGDLPDVKDLLESLYDVMPTWDYTADAMPNLSLQERMTAFFDDLKNEGFGFERAEGGLDQSLRDFLYKKAQELAPKKMFEQLGIDRTKWDQMSSAQIAEIAKMMGRHSVLDDDETRRYIDMKMKSIKRVNIDQYNSVMANLAAKGVAHSGAVVRGAQDLYQRLGEAEMNVAADVFMRGIELAEQGKSTAMQTWSQLTGTEAELIMQIGGLKTTLFGQYFDFLSSIGGISANEYATKTQASLDEAGLKLKYDLGMADLDVQKYISDRGLDLDGLRLDYENYWRDRGADLEEKNAEFNAATMRWQTAASMVEMINAGRQDRLVQMADLSLKALSGDREAWTSYQQLALQERLQQRGMDTDQAEALANLAWNYYSFGENMDYEKWATKYDALLRKELLRMGIEGEKELIEYRDELEGDGFFAGIIKAVGGFANFVPMVGDILGQFNEPETGEGGGPE